MTPAEFRTLSELVNRRSGLLLQMRKADMISSRLELVAQRFGFHNARALMRELPHARENLAAAVVEALLIKETSFFRDEAVFDHFRGEILPALMQARAQVRRLRIWCAGVANGQEAYSLAMIFDEEQLAQRHWHIDLAATDLSNEGIARAENGLYTEHEVVRGLSPDILARHFAQEGNNWRINERLRRMVTFRVFNLLDDYGWLGSLDAIFCRNVLIYFDAAAKASAVRRMATALAPGGCLILGASESIENDKLALGDIGRVFHRHAA